MRVLTAVLAWLLLCFASLAHGQTGGGFPPAVKPIICSAACSAAAIKPGQALVIQSSTNPIESRTSTVTMAPSTVFSITNIPTGIYRFTGDFEWIQIGGAGGFRGNIQFGATCGTSGPSNTQYIMNNTTKAGVNITLTTDLGATTASDVLIAYGHFQVLAGPAQLILCWAQNVSNATSTNIPGSGGFLQLERLQ